MFFTYCAANFVTGLSLRSAKRFKISVMFERISVPYYYLSGNDLVMKLCPKLSFRCLSLSLSVFLKAYEYVDLQLVHSFSPLSALSTYFFFKKKKTDCSDINITLRNSDRNILVNENHGNIQINSYSDEPL